MPVITKIADVKSSTENDVYNNRSIQELEQRLEELVLEEPPCQTKVNVQSSVLPTKETAHDSSFTYKQYFKLKLFSRGAVELLAIGAALSGTKYAQQSKEYGSTSTISTISSVVTDSLLCGSMNLLLYNSGFSYSQMLVANLLAYPVKSHSFLGGFGQLAGGILSTFLGGRGLGFNVGINAQPITIKIDPSSL